MRRRSFLAAFAAVLVAPKALITPTAPVRPTLATRGGILGQPRALTEEIMRKAADDLFNARHRPDRWFVNRATHDWLKEELHAA